jgi:hypothetical protein
VVVLPEIWDMIAKSKMEDDLSTTAFSTLIDADHCRHTYTISHAQYQLILWVSFSNSLAWMVAKLWAVPATRLEAKAIYCTCKKQVSCLLWANMSPKSGLWYLSGVSLLSRRTIGGEMTIIMSTEITPT